MDANILRRAARAARTLYYWGRAPTEYLSPRKKKLKPVKPGPLYSEDGIPYDYIVVIDAGSKGSRVYVYNWLNPAVALEKKHNLAEAYSKPKLNLLKRFSEPRSEPEEGVESDDSDSDSDDDDDDKEETPEKNKKGGKKNKGNKDDKKKKKKKLESVKFPKINSKKKWHQKVKPGISSFNSSPQKIGKHHLNYLLRLASSVVPKSQHYRTPIFLHSTAGMRLLNPTEQQQILDNICSYISSNSDFYIPECSSHVNVIDGDIEGIYGWLSINSLKGALDHPEKHDHGKNHNTYGLLDMGGASTQVVFQPNKTEIDEHSNNLFRISFAEVPIIANRSEREVKSVGDYNIPERKEFNVYSDSFLGFGMYQAHNRYLSSLFHSYLEEHDVNEQSRIFKSIGTPIPDPCLPKGYTTKAEIDDYSVDFTGESDFSKCLTKIFPVLSNNTYSAAQGKSGNCKQFSEEDQVSSCLLNDLIPAFDFDVNHFVGVSGYWDAISSLLSYENVKGPASKRDNEDSPKDDGSTSEKPDDSADTYDYKVIYTQTNKICSSPLGTLIELNTAKPASKQLTDEELSELCFKSSWILNFLHLGLGFPRLGIDNEPAKNKHFKSLELVEDIGGSSFSWTLGRAILYANDEYVQAFNNYTIKILNLSAEDIEASSEHFLKKPGFYHTASSSVYHFGAEQNGIPPRPMFVAPRDGEKYHHYDYETPYRVDSSESKWYIEPHRWYGIVIFIGLLGFIGWLMLGRSGRSLVVERGKNKLKRFIQPLLRRPTYIAVPFDGDAEISAASRNSNLDLETGDGYELNDFIDPIDNKVLSSSEEADSQFKIDSDDE
ncbi:nucleoside diphosphatase [Scheffersomyces xylosifermentans]|uniref:nucleoside diphosphatase n=1 Tax=Scheffersomyces xylosifermentans TaxID=1304137 RepID=UPI00315CA66E